MEAMVRSRNLRKNQSLLLFYPYGEIVLLNLEFIVIALMYNVESLVISIFISSDFDISDFLAFMACALFQDTGIGLGDIFGRTGSNTLGSHGNLSLFESDVRLYVEKWYCIDTLFLEIFD